jgi:hypothetical protein
VCWRRDEALGAPLIEAELEAARRSANAACSGDRETTASPIQIKIAMLQLRAGWPQAGRKISRRRLTNYKRARVTRAAIVSTLWSMSEKQCWK